MRIRRFVSLVAVLASLAALTWAQTSTSSLRGTVFDPKGAVVPGATVTLSNPATGFSRTAKTDGQGGYQFREVPPATYSLTLNAAGFANLKQDNVVLQVSTPATLDLNLQVQGVATTVEVSGAAPMVNTQDATLGHAFNTQQIESLPFEGRDPTGILSLQPGVAYTGNSEALDPTFDSRSGAVAGARSDQTNITIDGLDNNDPVLGVAFKGALRTTLDSLQEFRVTTTGGNADEGRSSGAQVTLVTKTGTNSLHGTLYEYHRPTFTTANDWFIKNSELQNGQPNVPVKVLRNTFGAALGGPILKNRLFFFGNYEGERLRENTIVTRVVPSANLRNGIVSYLCDTTSDPNCPAAGVETLSAAQLAALDPNCSTPAPGFPNGTCPLGPGPNPAVLAIFQQYPLPNTDSVGDGLNFRGFNFSAPAPRKLDTYVAKLDYNLTENGKHRLFVRGNLQNDHLAGTGNAGGPQFPGQPPNQTFLSNNKGIAAGYTAMLTDNLINNFRYGFVREGDDTVGLQSQHYVNFRQLDNLFGETSTTRVIVPIHNFVDDITWTKGKHTLQFGTNLRIINNARQSNGTSFFFGQTNVSWLANSAIANTGQSLDPCASQFASQNLPCVSNSFSSSYDSPVAAVTGIVPFVAANYNLTKTLTPLPEGAFVPRHFRAHEGEWYAQDSWRVTPNFTLTFGLRYTLLEPPYETTGTQTAPTVSLNNWFNTRGQQMNAGQVYEPLVGFALSGKANGKKPYWDWDYKDIAPRLAFAWAPSSKFSIRGGWGMYYDHFGEGIVNSFDRLGSFGLTTSVTLPAGLLTTDTSPRFSGLNTIPATAPAGCATPPCSMIPPPPSGSFPVFPSADPNSGGFAITWGLDDKLKTPYSHVINFTITRELPKNFVVEASYVGRLAHRLLQEDDLAMPLNLVDPKSGLDYFSAAQALAKAALSGTPIKNMGSNQYWEDMYPGAAGLASSQIFGCSVGSTDSSGNIIPGNVTATQAMYDLFACFPGNETFSLFFMDLPLGFSNPGGCFPSCASINGQLHPFAYFDPQWSSLYAWRSVGKSYYNALQLSLRKRMSSGLNFDVNYTYSKSIDSGSNAERINQFEGGGFASQIINSWRPEQLRGVSDFDTTQQINANAVYDLPFGRGKTFGSGMHGIANAIFGGWQLSGLFRWTSGFPFTVEPGLGFWATNWELTSAAMLVGPAPKTGSFMVNQNGSVGPNVFQDPTTAARIFPTGGPFRLAFPGESGQRNNFRGPGTFDIDTGLGKSWKIAESKALEFRWETFNVTNTPRFDVGTMQFNNNASLANGTNFGRFTDTLNKPRLMQFALRFSF